MAANSCTHIELFQGGFETNVLQEGTGQDGYLNFLREDIKQNGPISKSLGLLNIVTRCLSAQNDNQLYNLRGNHSTGVVYPCCFVLRMVSVSTPVSRRLCLENLAAALNKHTKQPPHENKVAHDLYLKRKANKLEKYFVQSNCDLTPGEGKRRKLGGHAVVSRSVVELIKNTYSNITNNWAKENPSLAAEFFDAPFPGIAIAELGYSTE